MQISPPPLPRVPVWCRRAIAIAALSLLGGCGVYGDFGQLRPSLVNDGIHDWVGGPTSSFEFTDDERQLRDLAYPLIEAPYDRQQWYSVAGEYGAPIPGQRNIRFEYASRLLSAAFRSPTSRYSRIMDDIRNDMTRLPQFFETAARVTDIDQKRRKSLAFIADISPRERDNALRRINDNAALIFKVRDKLAQRIVAYRFALERLVIMTPSNQAAETERLLNELQTRVAYYRGHMAPTWAREQSLASAR